jgi:amidase
MEANMASWTREKASSAHATVPASKLEWLSASEAATAVRARTVSSRELVETLLTRIVRCNRTLNAIVTVDADGARRQATAADEALALGRPVGPLHGIPMTIKDSFETAGLCTTAGFPPFARRVPANDALTVARLRQAGAIIVGKTNLPTLASGIQSDNPIFGRTNNPWDLARTPGGSSGGAAAAVAAGLSYLELGSDIGGSIRIPAHFCGVYGLKTTAGRVPGKGHLNSPKPLVIPAGWEPLLQLAAFGPLARSVEDLALALRVLSGTESPPLKAATPKPTGELRLAWTDDFGGTPLDTASRQRLHALVAGLEQAGCHMEQQPADLEYDEAWYVAGVCLGTINTLFQPALSRQLRQWAAPVLSRVGTHHPLTRGLYAGLALDGRRVREALARRDRLIEQLERFLGAWDAWLCPVFPTPAFTHRSMRAPIEVDGEPLAQRQANLLHSVIFNLTGHPVVSMPIGTNDAALPVGIQVVGRRWGEMELLAVASQIDRVVDGYRRPPAFT